MCIYQLRSLCRLLSVSIVLKRVTNKSARPLNFLCIMLIIETVSSIWDLWRKTGNGRGFSPILYFYCVSPFLGSFVKLRKATISCVVSVGLAVCLSLRPSVRPSVRPFTRNNSAPTGRKFMKFDI